MNLKTHFSSRKGFTLIELLVVIGILAVLAAIAIPSVAGLIDRANKSADTTNANSYSNAMERFISEYELYKQDIASGLIKDNDGDGIPDNMDASQSRVFSVTGADSIEDIRWLESAAGFNGIRIDIDNKYALNAKTVKTILNSYTKTSSSTFEPKQSDMTYWYHTETGYTVVAPKNIPAEELDTMLPQELRQGGVNFATWIDLSENVNIPVIEIPKAYYFKGNEWYEGITFEIVVPNPKYNDIDFSKIHMIMKYGNDELTIDNAEQAKTFQESIGHLLSNMEKNTNPTIPFRKTYQFLRSENHRDTDIQFRIAYEYEEDGETKYAYSPSFTTTCNELIAQDSIWPPK